MRYGFKKTQFAYDIRLARITRRLTQKQVGKEFGVGGSSISNWEAPKGTVPAHRFLALCYLFDLNPTKYFSLYEEAECRQEKLIEFDDSRAWQGDIESMPELEPELEPIGSDELSYAEWRAAGNGEYGMPVAEDWQ